MISRCPGFTQNLFRPPRPLFLWGGESDDTDEFDQSSLVEKSLIPWFLKVSLLRPRRDLVGRMREVVRSAGGVSYSLRPVRLGLNVNFSKACTRSEKPAAAPSELPESSCSRTVRFRGIQVGRWVVHPLGSAMRYQNPYRIASRLSSTLPVRRPGRQQLSNIHTVCVTVRDISRLPVMGTRRPPSSSLPSLVPDRWSA